MLEVTAANALPKSPKRFAVQLELSSEDASTFHCKGKYSPIGRKQTFGSIDLIGVNALGIGISELNPYPALADNELC
ncbi:hypothetical protein [Aliiglaciecola sp. M165]|uniref:hypothetical protein n=1 Tax=Aliiglaciecola sp. M165 TaxID=2593649 RepID=UPI00117E54A4|nr:hypothetical protein [Aliiglaciecola sp. M165]TRY31736.1 hypothetical protein FM019_07765 [Aliiglaciecola sp. M165]